MPKKKKPGRPRKKDADKWGPPAPIRLDAETNAAVTEYQQRQGFATKSEAMRRLLRLGLRGDMNMMPRRSTGKLARDGKTLFGRVQFIYEEGPTSKPRWFTISGAFTIDEEAEFDSEPYTLLLEDGREGFITVELDEVGELSQARKIGFVGAIRTPDRSN